MAVFGGGALHRYLPNGKLDHVEKLPFSQPTKSAFGGPDLRTPYVTSTRIEVPGFPRSGPNGVLYAFEPGVQGLSEPLLVGEPLGTKAGMSTAWGNWLRLPKTC